MIFVKDHIHDAVNKADSVKDKIIDAAQKTVETISKMKVKIEADTSGGGEEIEK